VTGHPSGRTLFNAPLRKRIASQLVRLRCVQVKMSEHQRTGNPSPLAQLRCVMQVKMSEHQNDWTPLAENFNTLETQKVMTGHPSGRTLTFKLSDWTPFGRTLTFLNLRK